RAMAAGIDPGPDVLLLRLRQDVIARAGDLVLAVGLAAERFGVRPLALVPARVRSDLVAVLDGLAQARPETRDRLALCAHRDRGFDPVDVERVDRLRDVVGGVVESAGHDRARPIEETREAVVAQRRRRLGRAQVGRGDAEARERISLEDTDP